MAESNLIFSAEAARDAARYFLLRRYRTKLGLMFIGSIVLFAIAIPLWGHYFGANWFVGFLGTVLGMNLIIHATAFYSMPRALAKRVTSFKSLVGHVTTSEDGITLSVDGNVAKLAWSRIRYIWCQSDFIILGLSLFQMIHLPTRELSDGVQEELERRASSKLGA